VKLQATIEIECASATDCGGCYYWGAALCRLFGAPAGGHMRCADCRATFTAAAPVASKIPGLRALTGREQG